MVRWIGCPDTNFRKGRPFGLRPEAIVVHIMDGSFAAGESVFRDPTTHKSAHYGISRAGEIHHYVNEADTAFHAGIVVNPTWPLLKPNVNPNFYTIGIEHEGRPDDIWPDALIKASATLIGQIAARWDIPLDDSHVIRHHQIRASKSCPGNVVEIGELLDRVPTLFASNLAAPPSPHLVATATAPPAAGIDAPAATTTAGVTNVADLVNPSLKVRVVRTIKSVNLRREKPATTAQLVSIVPPQTEVVVAMFVTGESVAGNAFWYVDLQGHFLWAGATNTPDPTALAA